MSFFESVVQRTRKLERLLEEKLQASGKGLHEKATSVEHKLDSDLVGQIRFIASVRNKLMHVDGYVFDGKESDFLGKCDDAIRRLEKQPRDTSSSEPEPEPKPKSGYTYTTGNGNTYHSTVRLDRDSSTKSGPSPSSTGSRVQRESHTKHRPTPQPTRPSRSYEHEARAREASRLTQRFLTITATSLIPTLGISFVIWLVVGTGACLNRFVNVPFRPEDAGYGNNRLFKYIFAAYLCEALIAVGGVLAIWLLITFLRLVVLIFRSSYARSGKILSARPFVTLFVSVAVLALGAVWVAPGITGFLTSTTSPESSGTTSSQDTPRASRVIKADKVTKGRTADEKVYEFLVPANQWVETALKIQPNQEVMVHHFASNEPVKVNLGGKTETRLQKAGTVYPMYTSTNCTNDKGVKAKVPYICIYLTQPESIKLFAAKSVRVGVVVKNR